MELKKLTTLLVVERIESCLSTWEALGYRAVVRVPETGPAGFVILNGPPGELMLQTRESLAEDLPEVAKRKPAFVLYADVASLEAARKALPKATTLVAHRKTFYGADESWVVLEDGVVMGLSVHGGA
jgi:hypothetical protein